MKQLRRLGLTHAGLNSTYGQLSLALTKEGRTSYSSEDGRKLCYVPSEEGSVLPGVVSHADASQETTKVGPLE